MRIAVVTPIPTPYRDPFWSEVACQPGVELQVFYCSAGKGDRPWERDWAIDFPAEVLQGRNLMAWRGADASCYWNREIIPRLRSYRPDAVIIGGYNHLTMLAAMRHCLKNEIPYFLMCESYLRKPGPIWKRWIKERIVRQAVSNATGGFPTGQLAEQYMLHYGVIPKAILRLPNVPDVIGLESEVSQFHLVREELRRDHGLDNRPIVLFVGRLIPKKRAGLLIRAFHKAQVNAQLVIVGSGPEQGRLEGLVSQLKLQENVHFPGFVQPSALPCWYAMADLFVLPSTEPWGVVVLEALASGLPVIITNETGCYPDLITSTNSPLGEVVAPGDETALASALQRRVQDLSKEVVKTAWQPLRERFCYTELAARVVKFLETALYPSNTQSANSGGLASC